MSGQSSSIPKAITYLFGLAQQAATAVDASTMVVDGWPTGARKKMFAIGADRPPEADEGLQADGSLAWQGLGAKTVQEDYGVPCWIYAASGGTDQAKCRADAFELWDAFYPLLRADLSLGGALSPQSASIAGFRLEGPRSADEAGNGRYALILFTVQCANRY